MTIYIVGTCGTSIVPTMRVLSDYAGIALLDNSPKSFEPKEEIKSQYIEIKTPQLVYGPKVSPEVQKLLIMEDSVPKFDLEAIAKQLFTPAEYGKLNFPPELECAKTYGQIRKANENTQRQKDHAMQNYHRNNPNLR